MKSAALLCAFCVPVMLLVFLTRLWSQDSDKPLPEMTRFLADFRKTLHSDRTLLSQYTYTEKRTEVTLDSKLNPKKTETNVYQVIHGAEEWQTYERLISKNGKPLSEKELEKQDREQKEHIAKETQKRDNRSEAKRKQQEAKADREEQETIDDIFSMYEIGAVRREVLDGRPTILLNFKSRPNYKPRTDDGKILQHIAGHVWVAEEDHELARLEAEVVDPISLGAGLLARLHKGSTVAFERRKINNEIWLPVRAEASLNGRLLLLKGVNLREVDEYSDHKKYTVDTILKFGTPPEKRDQ